MQSVFFFVLRLCLLFTFQSDFIYYAINCFWICAVKVCNAKLRNYLKLELNQWYIPKPSNISNSGSEALTFFRIVNFPQVKLYS